MSVNEMAKEIKNGNTNLMPELWEHTKKFIYYILNHLERHNPANTERMIQMGLTHEDIHQEAYFILIDALEQYDPDKGYPFINSLKYASMQRFFTVLGMRTKTKRKDPFAIAERFEQPLKGSDENKSMDKHSFGDYLSDESAITELENVLDNEFSDALKKDIYAILNELEDEQKETIIELYYKNKSFNQIATEQHISQSKVYSNREKAFRVMKRNHYRQLRNYAKEMGIINTYAYRSSLNSFRNTWTSSTERAAIKLIEHKEHC